MNQTIKKTKLLSNQEFTKKAAYLLSQLYPNSDLVLEKLTKRIERVNSFQKNYHNPGLTSAYQADHLLDHETILITYGNSITKKNEAGLVTLNRFLAKYVGKTISTIHLLPIFPSSSDDGFSVIDYKNIDPQLGTWDDIAKLSNSYYLMFDAVINHVSRENHWFKNFIKELSPEKEYFIVADPSEDYSMVVRPRAIPLFTKVKTESSEKFVWTTFSSDQIDLNYRNPDLLIEMISILLEYAKSGASIIRLDAIAYCWKKKKSKCTSLPETHALVKLIRLCLDHYAPGTRIITETNVPHLENISYFGEGDEANLVYQFALPPLTLFSFRSGNAEKLMHWLMNLEEPPDGCMYFNFLSSHDGIGLMPVENILDEEERGFIEKCTLESGGRISYKDNGDGTLSPYELNINYQDALASIIESDAVRIERFLSAETFLISLKGVPGIYIQSLLGSRNNYFEMSTSGISRRINRGSLDYETLLNEFQIGRNRRIIFDELIRRLKIRSNHSALGVHSEQHPFSIDPALISFERRSTIPGCEESIIVIINVSDEDKSVFFDKSGLDLLTDQRKNNTFTISPRSSVWLLLD